MATLATPAEKKGQQVPEERSERKPRPRVDDKFKIFCGTANEALAEAPAAAVAEPIQTVSEQQTTTEKNAFVSSLILNCDCRDQLPLPHRNASSVLCLACRHNCRPKFGGNEA